MTALARAREIAAKILDENRADAVLGLVGRDGVVSPALMRQPQDAESLVLEPKILVAKIAHRILHAAAPGYRLAVLSRGCDERALMELAKMNQLDPAGLEFVGVACSQTLAARCMCLRPFPNRTDVGRNAQGVDPFVDPRMSGLFQSPGDFRSRARELMLHRCIKCYGCRNACPLCVCDPCRLSDSTWVSAIDISPEPSAYHLIRAFHLADRCVACGACQEACPADIPLMGIQLYLHGVLMDRYAYEPGFDAGKRSPLLRD